MFFLFVFSVICCKIKKRSAERSKNLAILFFMKFVIVKLVFKIKIFKSMTYPVPYILNETFIIGIFDEKRFRM